MVMVKCNVENSRKKSHLLPRRLSDSPWRDGFLNIDILSHCLDHLYNIPFLHVTMARIVESASEAGVMFDTSKIRRKSSGSLSRFGTLLDFLFDWIVTDYSSHCGKGQ